MFKKNKILWKLFVDFLSKRILSRVIKRKPIWLKLNKSSKYEDIIYLIGVLVEGKNDNSNKYANKINWKSS